MVGRGTSAFLVTADDVALSAFEVDVEAGREMFLKTWLRLGSARRPSMFKLR